MHILFVGAHPDDETLCSGTLAQYAQKEHKVTIVMATRGERGHFQISTEELRKIRTKEMENAVKILGAEVRFLNYMDADVPSPVDMKEEFVDVIRELKPDIVITWHPLTWRDDHRNVGQAVVDACFKASLPLIKTKLPYHPLPRIYLIGDVMFPSKPEVYVDITEVLNLKVEAAKQHKSQMEQWLPWHAGKEKPEEPYRRFEEQARKLGIAAGVKYAEAFRRGPNSRASKTAQELLP